MANALSQLTPPVHDGVCFHCQQCAEKYLKALLVELGLVVPKTHDLDYLLSSLLPHFSQLRSLRRGLLFLNDFAVDTRYPSGWTTKRQATSAVRWASRIRKVSQLLLGITS